MALKKGEARERIVIFVRRNDNFLSLFFNFLVLLLFFKMNLFKRILFILFCLSYFMFEIILLRGPGNPDFLSEEG